MNLTQPLITPSEGADQSYFAITVAGSDCSGGAGIQADLKTFTGMGVYGVSVLTCLVAEHAKFVGSVIEIPHEFVLEQFHLCLQAYNVDVVKTGMLPSPAIIQTVASVLSEHRFKTVVDPVMVASTGKPLISDLSVDTLKKKLLPLCYVMTPNLHEAAKLLEKTHICETHQQDAAEHLSQTYGCAVLLKGGHLSGNVARDILIHEKGIDVFESEKIHGVNTHGTGCTLSAALSAALAQGRDLPTACAIAKEYVTRAIKNSVHTKFGKLLSHLPPFHQNFTAN